MKGKAYLAAIAVAGVSLGGCSSAKDEEAATVVAVRVAEARTGAIERVITAEGILRALTQSAVTAKISSPVTRFNVDRGDRVRAGQVLAVLENRDLAAAVADAKGAYDQAAAQYRNLESATLPEELAKSEADAEAARRSLEAAKLLLDSRERLFKEGALARRQVDEAAVAHAQAKAQFDTAEKHLDSMRRVGRQEEVKSAAGQLESARAKYEAAQAQLSYSEIRSPIDGVVSERTLFPGEMATAGSALLTVMDVSTVIARLNLPQSVAEYVKVGQPAIISVEGTDDSVPGKVSVVSPAVDAQSTTVEVWIQAANPGERLHPGGAVRVSIRAGTVADAVLVPASALLPSQEGGAAVMVAGADSMAHERKVETGVRHQDTLQIVRGVAPGDMVVIAGGVGLRDGSKIRVERAGAHE